MLAKKLQNKFAISFGSVSMQDLAGCLLIILDCIKSFLIICFFCTLDQACKLIFVFLIPRFSCGISFCHELFV